MTMTVILSVTTIRKNTFSLYKILKLIKNTSTNISHLSTPELHSSVHVVLTHLPYSGCFSGGKMFVDMENFAGCGKKFVVTCTRALMGVARCIYGNCFVCKYFVVCFSTTKTTKILPSPPKNTCYTVINTTLQHSEVQLWVDE